MKAGLEAFKAAGLEGKLDRATFGNAYVALLQQNDIEPVGTEVCNAVFDLFDRDDNNIVDMMEVVCGISLLCQGTEEEKIHAVFDAFDENGDGFISEEEMVTFLTSVFQVVLTPAVQGIMRAQGVEVTSAAELATVTATECMQTADLNNDGKLSVEEFKKWFYAPNSDPSLVFSPLKSVFH